MRIIVTGSTGLLGSYLVPALLKEGHTILELVRNIEKSAEFYGNKTKKLCISESIDVLKGCINEFAPEIVVHLAAYSTSGDSLDEAQKLIDANIVFLAQLLNLTKDAGVKTFINTGTFAEYFYGDNKLVPAYLYSATKTAGRYIIDYYAKAYNFNTLTVVPYTIYGGNDKQKKIIDFMYESLNCEKAIDLSPGEQILDFIHINDVVDFYLSLLNALADVPDNSVFHLGTGNGSNFKQVVDVIEALTNEKANINWGGKNYRPTDVMFAVADTALQEKYFNWKPKIDLVQGVDMYLSLRKKFPL